MAELKLKDILYQHLIATIPTGYKWYKIANKIIENMATKGCKVDRQTLDRYLNTSVVNHWKLNTGFYRAVLEETGCNLQESIQAPQAELNTQNTELVTP